ncbi:Transcriptional regulator [Lapidilactobacillus concavus DSM 17758]|uniref:Transcriptional regulator n=2 Tax=Lapidilactobacillus TaxID=2767884 RepID=A0A0R1W6G6_9LACO|nr:Transcriptional regulator [Lapidilactobacillus concavus DSM 17758]
MMNGLANYQDEAYNLIKKLILTLKLHPGERINIADLHSKFNIGTTPIREAIIRLRREGLIFVIPQSGTYVSKINLAEVYQGRYVREHLEGLIVTEAVSAMTPRDHAQLDQIIAAQEIQLTAHDYDQFFNLDEQFHQTFYQLTQKQFIWNWLELLNTQFNRFRYLRLEVSGLNWDQILIEHRQIVEAVHQGDLSKIQKTVQQHLHMLDSDAHVVTKALPEYFERT